MRNVLNKYSFGALATATLVGLGAYGASAQQQLPPPPFMQQNQPNAQTGMGGMGGMGGMNMQMRHDGMRMGWRGEGPRGPMARMSPEDRQAFLNAKIAAVHAGLALTAEQEKLWPQAEAAVRDLTGKMMARREAMQKEREAMGANNAKPDPIEMMRKRADAAIQRGETMKKALDGISPLYATLTPEQKARLPHLAGRRFAKEMRGEMGGYGAGRHGMHHGWRHHGWGRD